MKLNLPPNKMLARRFYTIRRASILYAIGVVKGEKLPNEKDALTFGNGTLNED